MLSATYYIAPTGSDTNAGTSLQAPLLTLKAAYNLVQPGDTIEMRGGVYDPNAGGFRAWNKSGTAGAPITIEPYNNEDVEWDFSAQYHWTQTTAYGGCWTTTLPADSFVLDYSNVMVIGANGFFATPTGGSIATINTAAGGWRFGLPGRRRAQSDRFHRLERRGNRHRDRR